MTYIVKDKSVSDGSPIECYEFVANHKTWRFTSFHDEITVGGQLYIPLPITRTAIEVSSIIDAPATMDFNIPSDHELAKTFCYTISPKELVVTVRRVHEGDNYLTDFKIEWTGRLAGSAGSDKWGTIKTASILRTELNGYLSSVYYQKSCNHVLYDIRCKALRVNFTQTAIVTRVQSQIITVDDMVYAEDELINGTMTNTRTGEVQGIVSNNLDVFRIGYPFFDIVLGDVLELTLGCDHQRLGHCKNRFNNTPNYGGFDFVPEINPFEKLVYTTATRTETKAKGKYRASWPVPASVSSYRGARGGTSRGSVQAMPIGGFIRAPKPRPVNSRTNEFGTSSSEGTGNIPRAVLGVAVSAIMGRKRVPNHNLLWTGNLRPIIQTTQSTSKWTEEKVVPGGVGGGIETITHTETIYTTTTIGYYIDMHLGICLGPDVHLVAIYVDNVKVWNGDIGPARTIVTIDENETFLNGSIVVFQGGAFNQVPEPEITLPDYPGYVGIATVFLKNVRADLSMGTLSFEIVRIPNPLGLIAANNRIGDDLNIVTALVEVMTNEWGYGGLSIGSIDIATFTAMAAITAFEANICSIKIDNDVGVNEVIGAILDQALCSVFENPETALITGNLVRSNEINYSDTPRFNPNNIIEMRSFEKGGWRDTLEQARGLYTERDAEYNEVPVFIQNVANIKGTGRGKRTVTLTYPFIPNKGLATALLSRDMARLAAPNYSFGLLVNRDGAVLSPGNIILVSWPDYDLLNLPMQIISVRKQDINYNNVVLGLKQVKFPDNGALFGPGGNLYDAGFDVDPKMPTGALILTSPYYMIRSANGITSTEINPLNFPLFLPKPANSLQASFTAYIDNLPNTSNPLVTVEHSPYPAYGQLAAAISVYDGFATGRLVSITINGVINPGLISDIGETGIRNGRMFLFIGNEIMSFESAVDNGGASWTLNGVHRGLLDTVAQSHIEYASVYIMSNNFGNVSENGFGYPLGYVPEWLIVSNGVIVPGKLNEAFFTNLWNPTAVRSLCPPRPHNTKINGLDRSSTPVSIVEGASVTLTWATRTRLSGVVALQLDAAEVAETNSGQVQKHHVYHQYGSAITDIGGIGYAESATFTMPNVINGPGFIYVEAEIILGGVLYKSITRDRIPVSVS